MPRKKRHDSTQRSRRTRLAPGIYRYPRWITATTRVGRVLMRARFGPDVPLVHVRAWQAAAHASAVAEAVEIQLYLMPVAGPPDVVH